MGLQWLNNCTVLTEAKFQLQWRNPQSCRDNAGWHISHPIPSRSDVPSRVPHSPEYPEPNTRDNPRIQWAGLECTVDEMVDDECFKFILPTNARLATLYRRLRNIHAHIQLAFGGEPSQWFYDTSKVLVTNRAASLNTQILLLHHIHSTMTPYFRAMNVTYDTYHNFFRDETKLREEVETLGEDVRQWTAQLGKLVDASRGGDMKAALCNLYPSN